MPLGVTTRGERRRSVLVLNDLSVGCTIEALMEMLCTLYVDLNTEI